MTHLKSGFSLTKAINKLILIIIFFSLMAPGCSIISPQKVYEKVVTKIPWKPWKIKRKHNEGLKKKAIFYPLINNAGIEDLYLSSLSNKLIKLIEQEAPVIIKKGNIKIPTIKGLTSPEFGISIDTDLARESEEQGMNIMISGIINPVEMEIKKKGIWPFKKPYRYITTSLLINVVNLQNGTLLLSNLETKTIKEKIKEEEIKKKKENPIPKRALHKALDELIKKQAEKIAQSINESPWMARILTTEKKLVVINAGKDVGLSPNQVFEVYSRGEPIKSAEGRRLFLLGNKVGEIKVVSVHKTLSKAVPLNGGGFKPGQVVKLKH